MFTGIVEEIGKLKSISGGADTCAVRIEAHTVLEGTKVGDSIAVNGICLTAARLGSHYFEADVSRETIQRTSLQQLAVGAPLNLERALRLEDRLGGHIVSGHIDGTGTIARITNDGNSFIYEIAADRDIISQLVEKGSIAVEGISLTIAHLAEASFTMSVIPHTRVHTNLAEKKPGSLVNLECDMIGKYVMRYLSETAQSEHDVQASGVTAAFLAENGFF